MTMILKRFLAVMLTPFMIFMNCLAVTAQTVDGQSTATPATEIIHKPIESAISGKRIAVYAEVDDPKGIDIVRIYFKSIDAADYSFIPLNAVEREKKGLFEAFKSLNANFNGQGYAGILPAPAKGVKSFEYLILIKNGNNTTVKSQVYNVIVEESDDETAVGKEPIQVYSESSQVPSEISGFKDNIVIDTVESGGKTGAVVGLYKGLNSKSGLAESESSTTIAASSGEFSTTAIVISSVTAIAAVGGIAALSSGGSDSGDGDSAGSLNAANILGTWNYSSTNNYGCTRQGTETYYEGGRLTRTGSGNCSFGYYTDNVSSGTWSLSGSSLTLTGGDWDSRTFSVSGSSSSFRAVYTWPPSGVETTYYTR